MLLRCVGIGVVEIGDLVVDYLERKEIPDARTEIQPRPGAQGGHEVAFFPADDHVVRRGRPEDRRPDRIETQQRPINLARRGVVVPESQVVGVHLGQVELRLEAEPPPTEVEEIIGIQPQRRRCRQHQAGKRHAGAAVESKIAHHGYGTVGLLRPDRSAHGRSSTHGLSASPCFARVTKDTATLRTFKIWRPSWKMALAK